MYYTSHNQRGGHLLNIRTRAQSERAITSAESSARTSRALARRVIKGEVKKPRVQALTTS